MRRYDWYLTTVHPIQNHTSPVPYQSRTTWRDQFITQLQQRLNTSTVIYRRCIIVESIQNWFLTDGTNKSDCTYLIIESGWFNILKGYLPHRWNILLALFFRAQVLDVK
jgi:hypothetical protein